MPWDRKRLLGYVETIQSILAVTDKQELWRHGSIAKTKYQFKHVQVYKGLMRIVYTLPWLQYAPEYPL